MSPLDEAVARVALQVGEVGWVAGVGELVEVDEAAPGEPRQGEADEVGADEAGAAGDQYLFHKLNSPKWVSLERPKKP